MAVNSSCLPIGETNVSQTDVYANTYEADLASSVSG
jgi:hypothetical protein